MQWHLSKITNANAAGRVPRGGHWQSCWIFQRHVSNLTRIFAIHVKLVLHPVSILYKSIAGRYRPVRVADGPITARYRFIKNASWAVDILCFGDCDGVQ